MFSFSKMEQSKPQFMGQKRKEPQKRLDSTSQKAFDTPPQK